MSGRVRRGMNNVAKGTKFERRILHELEFYGGYVIRCADSKPVDLLWIFGGIPFIIECKDADSVVVQGVLSILTEKCKIGGCRGIFIWQDKYFNVRIYLLCGNGFSQSIEYADFKTLSLDIRKMSLK